MASESPGHSGSDDPILLIPGGGVRDPAYLGDLHRWGSTRPLAVFDLRAAPRPRAWWDRVDDLEKTRRDLGLDRVDVLAHSSGCRVALAYAASGGPVRRLGLVTPPATWLTEGTTDVEALAQPRLDEPAIRQALAAAPLSLTDRSAFLEHQRVTAPLGYAAWTEAAQNHAGVGETDFDALRAFFSAAPPSELILAIRRLTVPVHVIGGDMDLLSGNRSVREFASVFRHGTVEMIPGSGHYPWIDQPDAFREAIARWSRPVATS